MISSQGSQSSDFDVLNSQRVSDNDAVHVIKINRKIQDAGFQKMIQPTELLPVKNEDETTQVTEPPKKIEDVYMVPKELLDHLDLLIVKKKLPLRTLKFDIEFSKSKEEVARHLEEHSEKINNIDPSDLDKLFSYIGYGKDRVDLPDDVEVSNENVQDISPVQNSNETVEVPTGGKSETFPLKGIPGEVVPTIKLDIVSLRKKYAKLLNEFIVKSRNDQKVFQMMMSELGSSKEMPKKNEPLELEEARKEYFDARKSAGLHISESLTEQAVFIEERVSNLSPKAQQRIRKAIATFDGYISMGQFSEAVMLVQPGMLSSIVDPDKFEGMRTDIKVETVSLKSAPKENIARNEPIIAKAITPQSSQVILAPVMAKLEPSESLVHKIEQTVSELEIKKSDMEEEKLEIAPVEVDVVQEPTNFVPKKTKKVEEKDDKTEAEAKTEESAPVDKSVAELPATPQNVFPTEFEDKKLEVHHNFPGKPNEIRVFYDGKEIAVGEVTKDGAKIKVKKEYKSGFLLAETIEEKALKHAMTIIKTLKPQ